MVETMKITVELPLYSLSSGGIVRQTTLAQKLVSRYNVHLRIQKINPMIDYSKIDFKVPYSIGIPDSTFPESDIVITYSDNPYGHLLTELPQVKKVLIYMLSYGMCFERERKNIFNPKIITMSSTNRTKQMIESDGVKCHCVGFGLEMKNFYVDFSIQKNNYAAILYHASPDKQYKLAVDLCDELCKQNLIDGVITFGSSKNYEQFKHPQKLIKNYQNATPQQVRKIFNNCKIFIMPSITEGLNLTPIESTLCCCPAVICDGAIGDIFFDGKTCFIAEKNFSDIFEKSKELLSNQIYSAIFQNNMETLLKQFTWEKTVKNIEELF
jgi:glycosyltransferase involved in cell wall biosynthesis